jgi:hypothetical protein
MDKKKIVVEMPEGKRLFGELGVDERIILKRILKKYVRVWTEFM